MMRTRHLQSPARPHPVVAEAARELLNKSDNERSGVLSTAMSFLGLYRDPVVARVTAASDWRIADLIEADKPCSLYLVVPPSDISRTKPLMRLILNQIGRRLTERLPDENRKHSSVLMMLDEFPALGRLDFFESALAFMAGYGVRAYLIAQSLNQIEKAYGPNNAILDNCHVRIAFAANDERTAKRISDALGTTTEQRAQRNYAGHRLAPWLSHVMVSSQETQRPLLTPGEVMQLPHNEELIMVSGVKPIQARKIRYFEDRNFTSRILPQVAHTDYPDTRAHDWGNTEAGPAPGPAVPQANIPAATEDGGRQQAQEPDPGATPPDLHMDADIEEPPAAAEDLDETSMRGLKPAQRALGFDTQDKDFMPDF
jgi:type IV secretion system protein VirD4